MRIGLSLSLALLAGCASMAGPQAVANLTPTAGSTASGSVLSLNVVIVVVPAAGLMFTLPPSVARGRRRERRTPVASGSGS